jgi:hypothetical protein
MSYDISISLLKKILTRVVFAKALGKGKLLFKRKAGGQSNMTTILINSGQSHMTNFHSFGSTLQVLRTITVPRQYPPSTPSGTKLHFSK